MGRESRTRAFTAKQGQYLTFIHYYTKVNQRPPAEVDLARYFNVTPESAHGMVVTLARLGLIEKVPGAPRSIRVLVARDELPELI